MKAGRQAELIIDDATNISFTQQSSSISFLPITREMLISYLEVGLNS